MIQHEANIRRVQLVVIAVALGQKQTSLALGNLVGSSIANILAGFFLGLVFMKKSVTFDRSSKIYTTVLLGLTTVFVLTLYVPPARFKWLAGAALMAAFVIYVASVISLIYKGTLTAPEDSGLDSDSDSDDDSDGAVSDDECNYHHEEKPRRIACQASADLPQPEEARPLRSNKRSKHPHQPLWKCLAGLTTGLAALILSSYIIAHSSGVIGYELGLSGTVVGTTILSIATTLPEKFVAILGGARHQPGILVANTVGSNIFLVTLCGGVLFFWGDPDRIAVGFTLFGAAVMWASAVVIFIVVLTGGRRWMGLVSIGAYFAFLAVELANGRRLGDD